MKIIYIADDGKEFKDKIECENYEWILCHQNINRIQLYDEEGRIIEKSILDQETYDLTHKVIVPDDYALKDFLELADYMGWVDFKYINSCGKWIWESYGLYDYRFKKE